MHVAHPNERNLTVNSRSSLTLRSQRRFCQNELGFSEPKLAASVPSILGIGGYLRVLECVFWPVQLASASYTGSAGASLPHRQSDVRRRYPIFQNLLVCPAETEFAWCKSLFRNTLPVTPLYGILCEESCKVLKGNGLR